MIGFEAYQLPDLPDHLHFPRECEPFVAQLLSGSTSSAPAGCPDHVDPDHFVRGLERHGIGPVLCQRCEKAGELDSLPSWLHSYLTRSLTNSTALNMASLAELGELVSELHQAAVPVVLLKGAALIRDVYEHIGLRPMVDLDILVHESDLARASEILQRRGYRSKERLKHFANEHHLQFVRTCRSRAPVLVELHWRLSDHEPIADLIPMPDLWRRSVPAPSPWSNARVFDRADQILHSALHIAEHYGLAQLRWLSDLHELAQRNLSDNEWLELADRAVNYDLHLVLAACFAATRRWFGTDIPAMFWQEMTRGLPPSPLAQAAFARCGQPVLIQFELNELRSIRSLRGKLAHLLELLIPDPRFIRQRHRVPRHSAVWPYYLVRFGNGLRTGFRNGLQMWKGEIGASQGRNRVHVEGLVQGNE